MPLNKVKAHKKKSRQEFFISLRGRTFNLSATSAEAFVQKMNYDYGTRTIDYQHPGIVYLMAVGHVLFRCHLGAGSSQTATDAHTWFGVESKTTYTYTWGSASALRGARVGSERPPGLFEYPIFKRGTPCADVQQTGPLAYACAPPHTPLQLDQVLFLVFVTAKLTHLAGRSLRLLWVL
jgi:hypothetical protein